MYYVKTNTLNISNEAVASVASHVGLATPLHRHMSDFYFIYLSDNCPFQDDSYWYSFQEFSTPIISWLSLLASPVKMFVR
jgi:hypothetical protein